MKHLTRLLGYLRAHRPLVVLALLGLAVTSGLSLLIPILVRDAVDLGIAAGDATRVALYAGAIVAVAVVRAMAGFVWRLSAETTAQRITFGIRNDLYAHLQRLHFRFHDQAQSGQLIARLTGDVETIRHLFGMGLIQLVNTAVMAVATFVILLQLDAPLALVAMWIVPVLAVAVVRFGDRIRRVYSRVQQDYADLTTDAQENLAGLRVVRAFSAQEREIARFARDNWELAESNLAAGRLSAFNFPLFTFLAALGTAGILLYGGRQVIAGEISIGTFIAFNTYLATLLPLVRNVGWLTNIATRAVASGERIFELLDTRPQIVDAPAATPLADVRGDVRFEGVSFRYGDEGQVLHDISFHIPAGETVAFIGTTGSGKSSIMNLLPRYYEVSAGRILIDGRDIRSITLDSLRRAIAIVPQETFLFSATIGENIAYGRPDATPAEIEAAARVARAHEFISALPEGYGTVVGERGITLSGGQRQRVAIARAVLADPSILIFDDSTASVDTETEELIQAALRAVARARTTIIIGQRIASVMHASCIYVLDGGRIVERGAHAELLARGGLYAEIVRLQEPEAEYLGVPLGAGDAANGHVAPDRGAVGRGRTDDEPAGTGAEASRGGRPPGDLTGHGRLTAEANGRPVAPARGAAER